MNAHIERKISAYKRRFPTVKNLKVVVSKKPEKRLKAEFDIGDKHFTVHFGLKTAYTWADGAPMQKRRSYQARASKITNSKNQYTYIIPGTANSFAYWILW